MYKDKDKQREANKQASQRKRDKLKGVTLDDVKSGFVIPYTKPRVIPVIPERTAELKEQVNKVYQEFREAKPERTAQGNIRVSKPGDDDYVPMCETTRAFIEGRDKWSESDKWGKAVKCFGDLPMDVQASIDRLSVVDGKTDQTIKANRTAIAVNYQHIFPDRYHNTGMSRTDSTKGAGL